jgi:hypothetical protein
MLRKLLHLEDWLLFIAHFVNEKKVKRSHANNLSETALFLGTTEN